MSLYELGKLISQLGITDKVSIDIYPEEGEVILNLRDGDVQILINRNSKEVYLEKIDGYYNSQQLVNIATVLKFAEQNTQYFV